jgi:hypothetical protein
MSLPVSHDTTEKEVGGDQIEILEDGLANAPKESLARPLILTSSIYAGLAVFLIVVLLPGFGTSNLVYQTLIDKSFIRFALIASEPLFMLFSVFFAIIIFTNLFQTFGPIGSLKQNSRYYSSIKPNLDFCYYQGFQPPHITIQMPVYKESLSAVIVPTVTSLKTCISHYELHGGMYGVTKL